MIYYILAHHLKKLEIWQVVGSGKLFLCLIRGSTKFPFEETLAGEISGHHHEHIRKHNYIVRFMIVWTLSNHQVIFFIAIFQRTYEILLLLKRLSRIGIVHIKVSVFRSKASKKSALNRILKFTSAS